MTLPVFAQVAEPDTIYDDESLDESEAEGYEPNEGPDFNYEDFYELPSYGEFYFDTSMVPCKDWYGNIWDTIVIDPYESDPSTLTDAVRLRLQEGDECYFFLPCEGAKTSDFGFRHLRRSYRFHFGVDLRLHTGEPVYSAFDGIVRVSKYSESFGYVVVVRHYNGFETLYAHFSKLLVLPGQSVKAGDIIGLGGNTGHSTGSHLHFEVRFMGKAIDPNRVISFNERKLYSNNISIDKSYFDHLDAAKKARLVRKNSRYHSVRRGDTLSHIAYRYGTTVARLCKLNHISRNTPLRAGRKIRVR